jgi:hypothetical protein
MSAGRRIVPIAVALIVSATLAPEAQQAPLPIQDGQLLQLWSGLAPGALGAEVSDIPAITVYLPRAMTANTPAELSELAGNRGVRVAFEVGASLPSSH